MIALAASLFLLFYLLVPGGIFRFATSLVVPLKKFHKTKAQEITFAVVACFIPFWVTMLLVWTVAIHPFQAVETIQQRREHYRVVYSALQSDKQFDESIQARTFWPALNDVLRRQARFLIWYYSLVIAEAAFFWWLTSRYADFRENEVYSFFAENFLLPSISEWHVMLTDFAIPTTQKREIRVDVLTTGDILFKGKLGGYSLDAEGELSGLLLSEPQRFDRTQYLEHKKADFQALLEAWPDAPARRIARVTESYWRAVPSKNLYVPKDKMANLNVRHETAEVPKAAEARLKDRGIQLTISEEQTSEGAGGDSAQQI